MAKQPAHNFTHDGLQEDLAAHLRGNTARMVWTNTQLGPVGSPRPDVFAVDKSFANFKADAYEVKVSVSDLRHDVTAGKWQKYRQYAHRVWFAIPKGLVSLDDIPRECGVIQRSEKGWRAARKPMAMVLNTLPVDAWIKLLIESNPGAPRRVEPRHASDWILANDARKRFGEEVGALIGARCDARARYERATLLLHAEAERADEERARIRRQTESLRKETERQLTEEQRDLAETLGLPATASSRELLSALRAAAARLNPVHINRAIADLERLRTLMAPIQKEAPHEH